MQISFIIDIGLGSKYASDYGQTQKQSSKDILKILKNFNLYSQNNGKTFDADQE